MRRHRPSVLPGGRSSKNSGPRLWVESVSPIDDIGGEEKKLVKEEEAARRAASWETRKRKSTACDSLERAGFGYWRGPVILSFRSLTSNERPS